MLRVDLRELQRGPVETVEELAPDDPVFAGLNLTLSGAVRVDGRLQETGAGEYFWRAELRGQVQVACRRCLRDVRLPLHTDVGILFTDDPDAADDPSVYPLAPDALAIDLGEAVREELALSAPTFVLCKDDCAGLCPRCGADLNAGPCACAASAEPL